jgi:ABC-type lipoprotein export system ATPase subunit
MTDVVMRAEDVHKRFGRLEVLKGVSLDVAKGETVCIIGPSGSGKTTFIRCINHLEKINSGRITVNGQLIGYRVKPDGTLVEDSEKSIAHQRTQIGMVFQRFNLFPHKTALENIMEAPVHVLGRPKEQAEEEGVALLTRVGLADKCDTYPGKLSGGQQQRVAIARSPGGDRRGARRHGGARARGHDDDRRHPRDGIRPRGGRPRRDDGRRRDHRGGHPGALLPRARAGANEAISLENPLKMLWLRPRRGV